jgi:hypothetical protein
LHELIAAVEPDYEYTVRLDVDEPPAAAHAPLIAAGLRQVAQAVEFLAEAGLPGNALATTGKPASALRIARRQAGEQVGLKQS